MNRSYWPDAEATGQLLGQLCEKLAVDFDVTVMAGQPNANPKKESFKKMGSEFHNGVRVLRVPHSKFPKRFSIGRLCNLISFVITATIYGVFTKRQDVIVFETDPFLLPLSAPLLKLRHRCKTVFYLQDIYPDVAVALDRAKEGFIVKTLRWLLFREYRKSDRVIVLSKDMKELCTSHGVPANQIECIPNWCETDSLVPMKTENLFRKVHRLEDNIVVMHSGNMGLSQKLERILDAAEQLQNRKDIEFLFVGGGASEGRLKKIAESKQLNNVTFLPYQPWDRLSESLSAADVQLISVDDKAIRCLMPSKLYGILATGTAVLAIAPNDCELSEIITTNNVGEVVPTGDKQKLVDTITNLADNSKLRNQYGIAARQLAEAKCDLKYSVNQFRELLASLTNYQLPTSSIILENTNDSELGTDTKLNSDFSKETKFPLSGNKK